MLKLMAYKFVMFGMLGIFGQVAASAAYSTASTRRLDLTGKASLALFPFFGLIAFFYPPIAIRVGSLPWYFRGLAYMAAFYIFQLALGLALKRLGVCPWNYSGKAQIAGVARLADAPAFFAAGLAIEWAYPFVKAAASAM